MAKLGTEKKPVRFHVQTEKRLKEIVSLCGKNGWISIGGFEPDEPEDLCEVEYLLNPNAFASQPRMGNTEKMTIKYGPKQAETSHVPVEAAKSTKNAVCNKGNSITRGSARTRKSPLCKPMSFMLYFKKRRFSE